MRAGYLVLLLLCTSTLAASQNEWHWVKATSNTVNGWDISRGTAVVSIDGDKFSARLFRSNAPGVLEIELKGTITSGRITATEAVQDSDYSRSTYRGALQKKKWEEFNGTIGAESVTLTDGWGMIGINRSVPK